MCSDTFLRLPEEKRNRFLNAAWEEFTRVGVADVSINRIVCRARVARGSFYQYFKDKEDLMTYLLHETLGKLLEIYCRILQELNGDFFLLQTVCFDRFLAQMDHASPELERLLKFLRINPGIDPEKLIRCIGGNFILEGLQSEIDTTRFRSVEPEFITQVMSLSVISIATVMMKSAIYPERKEQCRKMLALRMDIIRSGSEK